MGQQADCAATIDGKTASGRAYLESAELRFRGGDVRVIIPFASIRGAEARDGTLVVAHAGGEMALQLGARAVRWAQAIRSPKRLIDKLGVLAGARVANLGPDDPSFLTQLAEVTQRVSTSAEDGPFDAVFYLVEQSDGLGRLGELRERIAPNGCVWVVSPKGRTDLRDVDVMAAARAAGLVDTKVVGFSATHTALKLVIPRAQRPSG
jgi:hypothetical protein